MDYKYEKFTGTLFIPKGQTRNYKKAYLKITGDGNDLYTSPYMDKTSRPVEIDVEVSGYNNIVIEVCTEDDAYGHSMDICLGNAGFHTK